MADSLERFAAEPDADDVCALPLVRRVAALLDQEAAHWRTGMALPRGWEFILFGATTRRSDLGDDGHHLPPPILSGDAPAKVMLGGRRLSFHAPIPIGAAVCRSGEVASIARRRGSAGALTIVTRRYRTTMVEDGALAVEEEEDMIYRAVADDTARRGLPEASAVVPVPVSADAERPYRPDETMLFRYSALGNNAHRIHYDRPFATAVEGYPALVVSGGLTGLMLVEFFRARAGREPRSMTVRMLRPLFCGSTNRLCIADRGDMQEAWVENERGERAGVAVFT